MPQYVFYCLDVESTGLSAEKHDVIELSLLRMSDGLQKTWKIKPSNFDSIDDGALRVNGHKKEDITWQTKIGRETYQDPRKVIIEIENFILEDGVSAETRCLIAQNTAFDLSMIQGLWKKCDSFETFPFGRRYLDTMIIELYHDFLSQNFSETGYSLNALSKKYGVKNLKAHTAEADTAACRDVFLKQVEEARKKMNITIL